MLNHLPVLIVVVPLFAAFAVGILGLLRPRLCLPITLLSLLLLLAMTVLMLITVIQEGSLSYNLGGWQRPFGIEFFVDSLNALVLVLISAVALVTAVHSIPMVERDFKTRSIPFYILFLLLVTGLSGMTITGDAFNLYVMIEITALTSYAMIALAGGRAYFAAFNYVIAGSIGAGFYLLGVGYLYAKTGTLNMAHLKALLPTVYGSPAVMAGFGLIIAGLFVKMALFPFHGWLPNAYTSAACPVVCLVGPLTTKVTVYVMIRFMFWVFTPGFDFEGVNWHEAFVWLSVIAICVGCFFALGQSEVKRMLAYILIAEIGYMVGGMWLANRNGMVGAVYHIINDALVTLCLFGAFAAIRYKTGGQYLGDLRGIFARMPFTAAAFMVGAFALIGVPPTSGFFSKWYLILGGIESGQWHFVAALLLSSVVHIILFLRIIEIGFITKDARSPQEKQEEFKRDEAPLFMVVSQFFVAFCLLGVGIGSGEIIRRLILPVLPL